MTEPRYIREEFPGQPCPDGYHYWSIDASGDVWFRRDDLRAIRAVPSLDAEPAAAATAKPNKSSVIQRATKKLKAIFGRPPEDMV